MKRSNRWVSLMVLLLGLLLGLTLTACEKKNPNQMHEEVTWDRDICEHCAMVLSDRRFAAQVVHPNGKAYLFDDMGCALAWVEDKAWMGQARFWTSDYKDNLWIDASTANWQFGNQQTPMGYGFYATRRPLENSLTFEEVKLLFYNDQTMRHQHQGAGHKQPRPPENPPWPGQTKQETVANPFRCSEQLLESLIKKQQQVMSTNRVGEIVENHLVQP